MISCLQRFDQLAELYNNEEGGKYNIFKQSQIGTDDLMFVRKHAHSDSI